MVRRKTVTARQSVCNIATENQERTPREIFREGALNGLCEACP